jgi:hypothetical protein
MRPEAELTSPTLINPVIKSVLAPDLRQTIFPESTALVLDVQGEFQRGNSPSGAATDNGTSTHLAIWRNNAVVM